MLPEITRSSAASKWFVADAQFDRLYPICTQLLSRRHWTPLHIARLTVQYLVQKKGVSILDIGSGAGKFCLAGAYLKPEAFFYGVEQRENLVNDAIGAKKLLGLRNVDFLRTNFSDVDFNEYNHFYFFNAFYENLTGNEKIDNNLTFSEKIYHHYSYNLFQKLSSTPPGTRLATYHTLEGQVPPCFSLIEAAAGGLLKFWMKIR